MIYLILWILCGFATAAIYQSKGRSFAGGFVGGILLGPLGVLFAAISSSVGQVCPHCKSRVPDGATVCKVCTRSLIP